MSWPKPRDFAGDGVRVTPTRPRTARLRRTQLRTRLVSDGERTYRAYSAEEWLEINSVPLVYFRGNGVKVEHPVEGGKPARRRQVRPKQVVDGARTYRAYSAEEWLENASLLGEGRPGHVY